MNPILDRLSWHMDWNIHDDIEKCISTAQMRVITNEDECNFRPFTQVELDTVLHSSGLWIAKLSFDERAFVHHTLGSNVVKGQEHIRFDKCMLDEKLMMSEWWREEPFEANTTLRAFLERIASGPCYGFFEGVKYIGTTDTGKSQKSQLVIFAIP